METGLGTVSGVSKPAVTGLTTTWADAPKGTYSRRFECVRGKVLHLRGGTDSSLYLGLPGRWAQGALHWCPALGNPLWSCGHGGGHLGLPSQHAHFLEPL